jgi:hypothetical protein
MQNITVTLIHPIELELLVKQTINPQFKFISYGVCGTDGLTLCKDINGYTQEFDLEDVEAVKVNPNAQIGIYTILNYLCNIGIIESGNYLVKGR